jgi:putative OPT family oligopeptide transporter
MAQPRKTALKTGPDAPYIPASQSLPEITVKAVVLGLLLSALLAAANAYLGLFAGMTVSASIPAAVISMAVLRMFQQSNILENNIVQTAASAGESLAAGVIFTIPALIILGTWTDFNYWEVTMIAGFGGLLGVLFTIPLRRALIVEKPLRFPEGVATAEVLKVGEQGGSGVVYIAWAALIGGLFKLGSTGLRLWSDLAATAGRVGGSVAYVGTNLSPALVAVGYIVGLNIAVLIFLGGALNWWVAIPILSSMGAGAGLGAEDAANTIWATQTRYLGVGAMAVGGLWALIQLRKSLVSGVRSGLAAYREGRKGGASTTERTDRDAPMHWVLIALVLAVVPLFFIFEYFTGSPGVAAVMAAAMLVAGFLFAAVAGYMAGLVGSPNNPISGVTIATVLMSSLLLLWLMGSESATGPAAAIFVGAVVACAAAIAGAWISSTRPRFWRLARHSAYCCRSARAPCATMCRRWTARPTPTRFMSRSNRGSTNSSSKSRPAIATAAPIPVSPARRSPGSARPPCRLAECGQPAAAPADGCS